MPSARWWKEFYRNERESLSREGLEQLIINAPIVEHPDSGTIIFPHTRLSESGELIAAAASAVIRSGCDAVLALGVLHGVNRQDDALRGIHGPDLDNDKEIWQDEFSLDNFEALLQLAAEIEGRPKPKFIARYPFLAGENPESLTGFDEVRRAVDDGAFVVATADMIHHGVGYRSSPEFCKSRDDENTFTWVTESLHAYLKELTMHDYSGFIQMSDVLRSDFRDGGPVLAALVEESAPTFVIDQLRLVNYADVLNAEEPTWVAAALVRFGLSSH